MLRRPRENLRLVSLGCISSSSQRVFASVGCFNCQNISNLFKVKLLLSPSILNYRSFHNIKLLGVMLTRQWAFWALGAFCSHETLDIDKNLGHLNLLASSAHSSHDRTLPKDYILVVEKYQNYKDKEKEYFERRLCRILLFLFLFCFFIPLSTLFLSCVALESALYVTRSETERIQYLNNPLKVQSKMFSVEVG